MDSKSTTLSSVLVYTDYGYGEVDLGKFQASLEQMASQSTHLNEAISKYFISQYTEMHQKEVSEEEAAAKQEAAKQTNEKVQLDDILKVVVEEKKGGVNGDEGEEEKDKEAAADGQIDSNVAE